ncbi:alpha/beta hydrolase [Sporosarcina sp. BI001-red]|uniref:alpha/beta hydrolase n=1 Tax=Sporosarcina sp. BI001-red TaxID=2282866 RepID=UPI000E28349A|nr:alpha/beta hydrolase [Sporosarcina sp. BI001-red]REB08056.1 alpha/beta hydrolase [Sporosarcina sp. BI001-red]
MAETFVYKHVNGCAIQGVLHETALEQAPLLIYIHGGGLIWGTRNDMNREQIRLYNEAGFNVFSVDYRLAPESRLSEIRDDLKDLLAWIKTEAHAQFDFNRERVAVIGSSAGGYLALLSGTFEVKPDAIVSFYGYGQVTGDWYQQPSPHFTSMTMVPELLAKQLIQPNPISSAPIERRYAIYLYCRQQGTWLDWVAGSDATSKSDLTQYAPVELADTDFPATLLIHGDVDEDVPYAESVAMKARLDSVGVPNELMTIAQGKHNFDANMDDPDSVHAVKHVIEFLQERFQL